MPDESPPEARTAAAERLLAGVAGGRPPGAGDLAALMGADRARLTGAGDRAAIGGHVRALGLGPGQVARLLADERATAAVLRARHGLADRLAGCVAAGAPLPAPVRHAFGVLSPLHEQVLAEAVSAGAVTRDDLLWCAFDGDALTRRLRSRPVRAALRFETTLGTTPPVRPAADDLAGQVRTDAPFEVVTPHGAFRVMVASGVELWRAATLRTKEPDTLDWLDDSLAPGDVLFDVGASVGLYSLWALHLGRGVRVVAFEPEPLSFARLNENLWLNGYQDATALPVALHDHDGVTTFRSRSFVAGAASPHAVDGGSGGGSAGGSGGSRGSGGSAYQAGCVAATLDGLLARAGALPPPTHLKIDVDGGQRAVLAGGRATMARATLRHVLVELFEDELADVTSILGEHGFERAGLRWVSPQALAHGRVGNARFARPGAG